VPPLPPDASSLPQHDGEYSVTICELLDVGYEGSTSLQAERSEALPHSMVRKPLMN
jgi:hypothetical protein